MEFCICDIGSRNIKIKKFIKTNKDIKQDLKELEFDIEFDKLITKHDKNNIFIKNSIKIRNIVSNLNNCYIGGAGSIRNIVKTPKEYNVFMNNKFLFKLNVLSSNKEAELEFMASKHKFQTLESMLSMGSRSCQIYSDNKSHSIPIGFKTPEKNSTRFKVLKNKNILGISSLYWAAKKIESKLNRKLADNTRGVNVNPKFIDLLESVDLSNYNEVDKNQITLMKKIMKQISGDKTKIIFKREWKNKDSKYVINWATGKALEF